MRVYKQLLLVMVVVVIAVLWVVDVDRYVTLEQLKLHRYYLKQLLHNNYLYVVLAYIGVYALVVLSFLPIAGILTMGGGFLFGTLPGALFTNIGATVGATLSFLLVRHLIGQSIQQRYSLQLAKFNKEIQVYGSSYLLFIHFIAIIPFFFANILAGLTNVSLWTFVWTTSVGIFPGSLIYSFAGQQLNTITSIKDLLSFNVLLVFVLLALLALIPFIIRYIRRVK